MLNFLHNLVFVPVSNINAKAPSRKDAKIYNIFNFFASLRLGAFALILADGILSGDWELMGSPCPN